MERVVKVVDWAVAVAVRMEMEVDWKERAVAEKEVAEYLVMEVMEVVEGENPVKVVEDLEAVD